MLHIATVHYASPRWVPIQARHLRRHLSVPFEVWTSLQGIDPAYGRYFDHVIEQRGLHAEKLNHLAHEICYRAAPEDLLMFLDGDAFPIDDPMPLITKGLERAPLVAVRRAENADEPQPHPCFCVTTVRTWRELNGDWAGGYMWLGPRGSLVSDVGGNLLRILELSETPWVQVLRSNGTSLDPLHFALYGDAIYHHGAGFRIGGLSPAHRALAPAPSAPPLLGPAGRAFNRLRWKRWERSTSSRLLADSTRMFERIERDDAGWLAEVRGPGRALRGDALPAASGSQHAAGRAST